jgi:hypothetical protein
MMNMPRSEDTHGGHAVKISGWIFSALAGEASRRHQKPTMLIQSILSAHIERETKRVEAEKVLAEVRAVVP